MTEQEAKKAAKPAVVKKKPSKPKVPADHPTYNEMIRAAIVALADRSGSSRQAIQKYILANYKVGDPQKSRVRVRVGLKRMEASGLLKHTKGKGASGSFRLGDKAKVVKPKAKKAAAAKKKPAAKKPAAKKATKKKSPKKAAVKKSAAKKPAKKSPVKKSKPEKKTSKPKKAKSPAKKKSKSKSPSKKKTTKKAAKK